MSLLLNIAIPVAVLMTLSGEDRLGPIYGLALAVAFPLTYGAYDLLRRRTFNLFSVLGLVSVLLTGGIGLLKLDPRWVAVKEAGIPLIIGLAVAGSLRTPYPLVSTLLRQIIDLDRVNQALRAKGTLRAFERRLTLTTYILAGSFVVSAGLNYLLARLIVVSPAGTATFNQELGTMTALSFPVIALPSIALFGVAILFLVTGIQKQTGLDLNSIFKRPP